MKKLRSYRMSENTIALIEELREDLHMANNSDVLRRALVLLKLYSDNRKRGNSAFFKEGDKQIEVVV